MNNFKFIKIDIEKKLPEDDYYSYYKSIVFYCNSLLSNEYLKGILYSIKPTIVEDSDIYTLREIDEKELIDELSKYGIYPVEIDLEHEYDM